MGDANKSGDDWLKDVRRWCLASRPAVVEAAVGTPTATSAGDGNDDASSIGYETAQPALQARHWPDAPTSLSDTP